MTAPARLRPAALAHPPALLGVEHAAAYLGISASTLRALEAGPPRRRLGARVVYLRADLDAWAASLPAEGEAEATEAAAAWDRAFG